MARKTKIKIIMRVLDIKYCQALDVYRLRNRDIVSIEKECGVSWEEAARFMLLGEELRESGTKDLLHRPEPGEEPGSGVGDLLFRPEPGEKPGSGRGPC